MIPLWNWSLQFVPLWMASDTHTADRPSAERVKAPTATPSGHANGLFTHECAMVLSLSPCVCFDCSPNLLTIGSLACGVADYFLLQYYSPDFNATNVPSWVFFLTSFLMFFYLILDGLDGKQARRTGSSGPLGQLFDHGCDSICCFVRISHGAQ